jgi:hypothetical protein
MFVAVSKESLPDMSVRSAASTSLFQRRANDEARAAAIRGEHAASLRRDVVERDVDRNLLRAMRDAPARASGRRRKRLSQRR